VAALLVASCGATVQPSQTVVPTARPTPTAAAPSQDAFVATAYPPGGDAPCDQKKAPDATHARYTGNLRRISAPEPATVVFELCRPDVAFLAKVADPAFAINDSAWLEAHVDPDRAGGQRISTEVNGTGPYRLERWDHGIELSLARNEAYWGTPARNERLIVRWRDNAAQRVVELQGATVDGIDEVDATGATTVGDDVSMQLLPRAGLETFYVGFNNTVKPFDDDRVRRAIAMGIDRAGLVQRTLGTGSEVASHYTPCAIAYGCTGAPWYEFDALLAKEMLASAGHPDGFDTTIQYSATPRPWLPDPAAVALDLQTQLLDNLGIRAELQEIPEATFIEEARAGRLDGIHLSGQGPGYPDITTYLDARFGSGASDEFGKKWTDITKALTGGRATVTPGAREAAYKTANDAIRAHVPMIPLAWTGSSTAYRADVEGAAASPLRLERFAAMRSGDRRQLVWLTTAEPLGLYCPDETDPISGLVCAQLSEGLYGYEPATTTPTPSLARSCTPDTELTTWTCTLRTDVRFHDGATFDAADVVLSYAVQWDAEHPLHDGREGAFGRFAAWFGGFLDQPAATP